MSSEVTFYRNDSPNNKAEKTLTQLLTTSFNKKLPYDIENPVITIHVANFKNANYAKIGDRYFFVKSIVENLGGICEISMECDYLSSAWNRIKDKTYMIERQEFKRNSQLIDNDIILQSNNNFLCRQVGNDVIGNYNIYLTTCGGVS